MHKKPYIRIFGLTLLPVLLLLLLTLAPAARTATPHAPAQPQSVIDACGAITTPTTWTGGNVYSATNCYVSVAAGVTLTIEPGVIVKFGGACPSYGCAEGSIALRVDGTLIVSGTLEQPVVFTSVADDAHGGDTNGDGASAGASGQWYGIVFNSGSHGDLSHTWIGYAGSGVFNADLGYGRAQVDARGGDVQIRYTEIISGLRKGIYLEGVGITPVIEAVSVAGNVSNSGSADGYAIYQASINMQPTYSALTFSGNDRDEVTIGNFGESLTQSITLGGTNFGVACGYTLCQLSVPDGMTLTVQPGTLLDFGASYGLAVDGGGSLIAEGMPSQTITFTSQLAAAGDAGQYWIGIWAQQGSTLHLDHCDISYANDSNYGLGGLEINTDDAQVLNCQIHHNKQNGLYVYSRDGGVIYPILTNVDITNNGEAGVYLNTSSGSVNAVTWDGGSIRDNGYAGVRAANIAGQGDIQLTLQNITISGNGTAGYAWNEPGIYANDHNTSLALENLTLINNVGAAVHWYCNGSITTRNLIATGNGADVLTLPGCTVSGGRQWDLGDAGIPVSVTGSIEVSTGGLLSIAPGTTLHFDKNQYGSPTALTVRDHAALYALGTAESPIGFTGAITETGWWAGIEGVGRAAITLRHCEISYGGCTTSNNLAASLVIRWGTDGVPSANIQNCEIHHSGLKGVHFDFYNLNVNVPPLFHYNSLHDNTQEAVTNFNAPPLDARDNYWGDPSGPYHPTQNPGGLGEAVGDNILFYPWQNVPVSGEVPGEMLVSTGSPNRFSPGEKVDYAVQYLNMMTTTVENGMLLVRLPTLSTYISSSGGSIYWPERHQVFWGLGDIPPGGQDWLIFTVQYQWSIPSYQEDNVATLLVADNYNNGLLDMTPYETYTPPAATETGPLTFAEWEAKLTTIPDLNTLYTQAVADGFVWGTADLVRLNNGDLIAQAMMLHTEQRVVRILYGDANHPYAATFWPGEYTAEDVNGGVHWNLLSNVRGFFGDWAVIARIVAEQTESSSNACLGAGCCLSNCLGKVALTAVAGKMSGAISKAITAYDCAKAYRTKTPEDWSKCAGEINEGLIKVNQIPVLSELIGITECLSKCAGDPNSNDCTDDLITCEPDWTNLYDWLSIPSKTIWRCQGGCYSNKPEYLPCAFGDCCMPGVGCVSGGAGGSNCKSATFVPAKDPNAIYGPVGDLFPGQPATYTITYENEGVGRAYGVYVVNPLPEVFDARTLTFTHNSGTYLPESREIMWWIGELGPKGAADSEGTITYTVTLTRGLPSGTAIANQAVVYFPSVPEETPTNSWVNLVAPLVATPQNLTTDYMAPLFLILSGREISGLPLTYEIIEQPRGGVLTGTLPNLTYTPVENFTGVDGFAFQVSNGITTSRPAQVYVTVTPAGDVTSPQVLWTNPATAATDVATSTTPVFTDTLGPAYAPALLIGVSEPLNATTVSTTTITLTRDGALIPTSVRFDGGANQIILLPRAAISPGRYTVAVSNGITDLAGNSLKAYSWSFSTAGDTTPPYTIYLPLILRKR